MRLDHLLSREKLFFIAQMERKNTFPPGLNRFGFGFGGAVGYRNNQAPWVCLFDSLTFEVFWLRGFLGWLFVFWRVDVSVFVMLFL